jgi:hypothetical protein
MEIQILAGVPVMFNCFFFTLYLSCKDRAFLFHYPFIYLCNKYVMYYALEHFNKVIEINIYTKKKNNNLQSCVILEKKVAITTI